MLASYQGGHEVDNAAVRSTEYPRVYAAVIEDEVGEVLLRRVGFKDPRAAMCERDVECVHKWMLTRAHRKAFVGMNGLGIKLKRCQ